MAKMHFTQKHLGADCKRVALVELEAFMSAMACILSQAPADFVKTIKTEYAFMVIPVMLGTETKFSDKTMAAVDADRAEKLFAFVREHADKELLETLKANYEFDLHPVQLCTSIRQPSFMAKALRLVAGVTIMMVLLNLITGCAESVAANQSAPVEVEAVKGELFVEDWGVVQSISRHQVTKANSNSQLQDVAMDSMELLKINERRFADETVKVGDRLSKTVFLTEDMAEVQLCKNRVRCKLHSVCYRWMRCFGKYEALRKG